MYTYHKAGSLVGVQVLFQGFKNLESVGNLSIYIESKVSKVAPTVVGYS